jgi:Carboxypeptidase regulatory-like domain
MRRSILASACVLVLVVPLAAGCASSSNGAAGGAQGIRGTVVLGPMCPVERVESPCPDRPMAATVVVSVGSGRRVASVRSGSDGSFSVPLAAGRYVLTATGAGAMRFAKPVEVTVRAGTWTRAVVQVDSGIR